MDDLLTTKQLQDLLQVDRVTIYRMLQEGRLEGFKIGGQWRFSRHRIQQWLQERQSPRDMTASPGGSECAAEPQWLSSSCMQAIQDIFAEALGVGAIITSLEGGPLTAVSRPCRFCRMVLSTETGRRRCIDSWLAGGPAFRPPRLATCHAGLNYLSIPIQVRDQVMAAIHAGQFLAAPSEPSPGRQEPAAELATATGLDVRDLAQALAGVPRLDQRQLQKVSGMLQRVAHTVAEMAEERLRLIGKLQRIAEISQIS